MEHYLFHQFRSIPEKTGTSKLFHSHEFWQVDFIFEGNGVLQVKEKSAVVLHNFKHGDTVIIAPGLEHCFNYMQNRSSWLSVKFSASEIINRRFSTSRLRRRESVCIAGMMQQFMERKNVFEI